MHEVVIRHSRDPCDILRICDDPVQHRNTVQLRMKLRAVNRLAGEAKLVIKKNRLFADIKTELDLSEYFPQVKSIGNRIDMVVLTRETKYGIRKIADQI